MIKLTKNSCALLSELGARFDTFEVIAEGYLKKLPIKYKKGEYAKLKKELVFDLQSIFADGYWKAKEQ